MTTNKLDKVTFGAGLFFATIVLCWAVFKYSDANPLWVLAGFFGLVGVLIAVSALKPSPAEPSTPSVSTTPPQAEKASTESQDVS
ncbi:MAG: hypothetical protein HOQ05_00785 [Corynebacteriales bacterium]|nr:hypothetical protein [Mycobacteriales bacterium]